MKGSRIKRLSEEHLTRTGSLKHENACGGDGWYPKILWTM